MPNMNIQFFFIFTGAHTCTCTIIALSLYSSGISILINDLASIKNSAFYNTDPVISIPLQKLQSPSPPGICLSQFGPFQPGRHILAPSALHLQCPLHPKSSGTQFILQSSPQQFWSQQDAKLKFNLQVPTLLQIYTI